MGYRRPWAIGLLVVWLVSCTSHHAQARGPAIATYQPGNGSDLMFLRGWLVFHAGCVMVQSTSDATFFVLPVWPEGSHIEVGGLTTRVLEPSGRDFGTVGRQVRLSGSPASPRMITNEVPGACVRPNRLFAVDPLPRR